MTTVHVIYKNEGWFIVEKGQEDSGPYAPKVSAIIAGRLRAIQIEGELVIHGMDGKIQRKHSYGNDPFPPEG